MLDLILFSCFNQHLRQGWENRSKVRIRQDDQERSEEIVQQESGHSEHHDDDDDDDDIYLPLF